jgi:hypothetical protein
VSTTSSRRAAALASRRLAAHPALPWLALAALCAVTLAVVLRAGDGLFFYGDDWSFLLHRDGFSPDVFLAPHNEHPSAVPVTIFKLLLATAGLSHFTPYLLAIAVLHVAVGVLAYLYARPRLGPWLALAPAALLLTLGSAWEDIMWPFQVGFVGSVAFGLAALLALDARRDGLACAALLLSALSSGTAIPFLAVAAVDIAYDPRRWRRAWVVVVPAVVFAAIVLGYHATSDSHASSPSQAVRFAIDMAAAGLGAFGGLGLTWGRPLLLLAGVGLVLASRRPGGLSPRVVAVGCGAVAYWLITAAGRTGTPGSAPDVSRYLYASAVLWALLAVTALPRRPRLDRGALIVVAALTALLCVSGAGLLKQGATSRLSNTATLRPRLAALEVARGVVKPDLQIDALYSPDITAASYFKAIDAHGSPAFTIPELRAQPDALRQTFDAGLLLALGLQFQPGGADATSGAAPTAGPVAGGSVSTSGSCLVLRPAGAGAKLEVTLQPGARYAVSAAAGAPVQLALRRLASTYANAPYELAGGATATLAPPRDRLPDPWQLQVTAGQRTRVCAAG